MRVPQLALALMGVALFAVVLPGSAAAAAGADATGPRLGRRQLRGPLPIDASDIHAARTVATSTVDGVVAVKKAHANIARAQSKEARVEYRASRRVQKAVHSASAHSGELAEKAAALAAGADLPVVGGLAAGAAAVTGAKAAVATAKDAKRVAKAVSKAGKMTLKAKGKTMLVVATSVGEAGLTISSAGGKALAAVGAAALHDGLAFAPLLAGLAPQLLPQLAGDDGLARLAPAALPGALAGIAGAIGGALLGGGGLGVAGPELLASRVASLIPPELVAKFCADAPTALPAPLLDAWASAGAGAGGDSLFNGTADPFASNYTNAYANANATSVDGGAPVSVVDKVVAKLPPQVVDAIVGWLAENAPPGALDALADVAAALPSVAPNGDVIIPAHALQTMLGGLKALLLGGGGGSAEVALPALPAGGVQVPVGVASNLLGVLGGDELRAVMAMLSRGPLGGLLNALPLGLAA